jgi:hypothetical protein
MSFPFLESRHAGWSTSLRRARGALLGGILLLSATSGSAETALQPGEELTYSVRWAILPSAGEIRIAASQQESVAGPQLRISTTTETRGLARSLMSFRARADSIFDAETGRILFLEESSVARSKQNEHTVRFDHANRRALFTGRDAKEPRELDLPEGNPADLITTLMKTRLWDLPVGESRDVVVSYRDEFYLLTVHATRTETVRTALGEFETTVLEPRMEKTAPKGMFKRGGQVKVWVSRDEARLPVRFQVEFKVGTGVATLVKYTPPLAVDDSRLTAD